MKTQYFRNVKQRELKADGEIWKCVKKHLIIRTSLIKYRELH